MTSFMFLIRFPESTASVVEVSPASDECDCSIDNLRNCVDRTFYEGKIFIEMEILYVADCYGFSADTRGFLRRKSA